MSYELKDWMNSINFTKVDLMMEDNTSYKDYKPYIINRSLSGSMDCILIANEMNKNSHLDKDMQYAFYLHLVRKKKRYNTWIHKSKIENLDVVKKYYGYSNEKALQALKILTDEQIKYIKDKLNVGGNK